MVIDGSVPDCREHEPGESEGFYLAVELAKKVDSDLIIGTDPDSDRVGVLVRRGEDYVRSRQPDGHPAPGLYHRREEAPGTLTATPRRSRASCERVGPRGRDQNDVHIEDTFHGFKFMAERIAEWEPPAAISISSPMRRATDI